MRQSPLWQLVFVFAMLIASTAPAQDWSITTADFRSRPALLHGLSPEGVRFTAPGSGDQVVISLAQFVSVQRVMPGAAPASAAKFTLLLANGDRLTGEPLVVAGERLVWRNAALGDVPVPLKSLVALLRGSGAAPSDEPPKQDVIALVNGDTVTGVVTDCSAERMVIRTDAGVSEIPAAAIKRVLFAAVSGSSPAKTPPGRGYRVKLADGSSVTAAGDAALVDERLTMSIDGSRAPLVQLRLIDVLAIEQLNGPVSWLSSRAPTQSAQKPYFGGAPGWTARNDAAVDGSPLRFGVQRFDRGIGVHAYSRLTYALDPGWSAFRTQYAIDARRDAPRPLADVTVRITVDGKVVHEQGHVRAGVLSPVVVLELTDAKVLTLEVDFGEGGDTQDHLNWIEAALLRNRPAPASGPSAGVGVR